MKLARQRIRLPGILCAPRTIDRTIEELENLNKERLSLWQNSVWLRGELFLILNEAYGASLCGYCLRYDQREGLCCEKEVEACEGPGL